MKALLRYVLWASLALAVVGCAGRSSNNRSNNSRSDRLIDRGNDDQDTERLQRNLLDDLARANLLNQNPGALSAGINPGLGENPLGSELNGQQGGGIGGGVGELQGQGSDSQGVNTPERPGSGPSKDALADASAGPNRRPAAGSVPVSARVSTAGSETHSGGSSSRPVLGETQAAPPARSSAGRPYLEQ